MKQFKIRDLGCEVFCLESGLFHAKHAEANDVEYAGVLAAGLAWGTPFAFLISPWWSSPLTSRNQLTPYVWRNCTFRGRFWRRDFGKLADCNQSKADLCCGAKQFPR